VSVVAGGLTSEPAPAWRSGLGLGDIALGWLADTWKVNLIRLVLDPGAVVGADASALASLDDLIASAALVGMHTLLVMDVSAPPGVQQVAASEMVQGLVRLAARYQSEPAVLFELCHPDARFGDDWPLSAAVAVGLTRAQHPASLILVGGVDRTALRDSFPLRITADTPIAHLVYTLSVGEKSSGLGIHSELRPFLQTWPTFASKWTPGSAGLSPIAEIEAVQLEQTGTGFAAWTWNSEPRLVVDAAGEDFSPTAPGLMVQRALSRPALDRVGTFSRR